MKLIKPLTTALATTLTACVFLLATGDAHSQGTMFTYQGRLNDGANPANGSYDLRLAIYDAVNGGTQKGPTLTNATVASNGLFTITLNFGYDVFTGDSRWLEIGVRTNGGGAFTPLNPRQPVTPSPYAMHAEFAGNIEPGSTVSFSGPVSFNYALGQPFYLGPGVTNLVSNLNAQYLAGKDAGQFWALGGNSGQLPSSYVLGTLDNNALEFRANGARGLRLEPTAVGVNFIAGNANNSIASNAIISTIGGGQLNTIEAAAFGATIAGGDINTIRSGAGESVISGGIQNIVGTNSIRSVIAGGLFNRVGTNAVHAVISGGRNNRITNDAQYATISGGWNHLIGEASSYATISGGSNNLIEANSQMATIGGGWDNTIAANSAYGSTIGGGYANRIDAGNFQAVIGGGAFNHIHTYGGTSVIGGGESNEVLPNALCSTIGGGNYNSVGNSASYATIGGGYNNEASGEYAVVPGGTYNSASGKYSFAAGYEARALHEGCFVWSEPAADLFQFDVGAESTTTNQFVIRASGGIQLHPGTSMYFGNQTRQMLNLWGTSYGIGVQDYTVYSRCANTGSGFDGFIWYRGGVHNGAYANAGGGTEMMHLVTSGLYLNGAIVLTSDRSQKENFKPVDPRAVLDKVTALPLSEWNYKSDTASRHLGPMAQDFYAAFGVGPDDRHIATVDADGVALAAIQGLNEKVEARSQRSEDRIQMLERENTEVKQRLEKLERLINQKNR